MIQVQKIYTFPAREDIHVLKAWWNNNNRSLVCVYAYICFPKIVITNLFVSQAPSTQMHSPLRLCNAKNMYSVCLCRIKGCIDCLLIPRDRTTPERVVIKEGLISVARRGLLRSFREKGFQFVVVQNNDARNQVFRRRRRRACSQSLQLLLIYCRIV